MQKVVQDRMADAREELRAKRSDNEQRMIWRSFHSNTRLDQDGDRSGTAQKAEADGELSDDGKSVDSLSERSRVICNSEEVVDFSDESGEQKA